MIEQEYRMACTGPIGVGVIMVIIYYMIYSLLCSIDCFKVGFMMVTILLLGANPKRKAIFIESSP
jgi:hypothetical protein